MNAANRYPIHGWAGLLLVAVYWTLNWSLDGPRTHAYFFPLWLGYTLTVDGLVFLRRQTSILTRSRRDFVLLFLLSAPAWWLFEAVNAHTRNWTYVGAELFSTLEYALLASLAFSTVMPAVFETAELIRSFRWVDAMRPGPRMPTSRPAAALFLAAGFVAAALIWTWPDAFYPLIWGMLFFLVEPINIVAGRPSVVDHLARRDWRPVVSLALGAFTCGIFWEMWNAFSYPKWTYRTPGVEFLYVFEMPLLGYLGYLPFGLELYALGRAVRGTKLNVWL